MFGFAINQSGATSKQLSFHKCQQCVLGCTHSHRCVSLCRSEVVISRQGMLSLVHLPVKTNGSIACREMTTSDLHKLTHRCECVRSQTQGSFLG